MAYLRRKLRVTKYTTHNGPNKVRYEVIDSYGKNVDRVVFTHDAPVGEERRLTPGFLKKFNIHRDKIERRNHDSAQVEAPQEGDGT